MLLLSLLSHLLEAACLERTGCECVCESVCVSVCVCVCVCARTRTRAQRGSSTKMLRACAGFCGANWHQEGTYAKSRPAWPLNLYKLPISCTGETCFLHALEKGLKTEAKFSLLESVGSSWCCPEGWQLAAYSVDGM